VNGRTEPGFWANRKQFATRPEGAELSGRCAGRIIPGNDGEATTLGLKFLAARTEQSYWRTRPVIAEEIAMMPGPGRLSGRGPVVAAAMIPALVRPSRAILRFRLAALLAAQLFDFGTFTLMVSRHGIAAEMNPLVAQGFDYYGLPILVVVKFALVILLGSIVVLLARDGPSRQSVRGLAASITILAVIGGLVGGISNVLAG
jgi:hypothetical protein